MKLSHAIRMGLGVGIYTAEELADALTTLATAYEQLQSQEPIAVIERVHGQQCVQFANGKTLYDMPVGMKLFAHPVVAVKSKPITVDEFKKDDSVYVWYDWSKTPDWAQWAAIDGDGSAWFYEHEPRIGNYNGWSEQQLDSKIEKCKSFGFTSGIGWKKSLQQRPEPVKQEQKTIYDWSKAPDWAEWAAVINHRLVRYFQNKPVMGETFWLNTNGGKFDDSVCDSAVGSKWKESLEQRLHTKRKPVVAAGFVEMKLPPDKHFVKPVRYIETNQHLIDLRRVQCVSAVDNKGRYHVTLVSGVDFPVDDKLYPRDTFVHQLVAYGNAN